MELTARARELQVGDYVSKAGNYTKPGVVVSKSDDGNITVDTNPAVVHRFHRHTNTSGLTLEEKDRFNSIMDEIMSAETDDEKINRLQTTIDAMRNEADDKRVVDTLRNQQTELMHRARGLPRVFTVDANQSRMSAPV